MAPKRRGSQPKSEQAAKSVLPESGRRLLETIQVDFNLADHLKNIIMSNPWVPPTGDKCPINDLPTELLAHIFTLGALEENDPDEEDDMYQENYDDEFEDIVENDEDAEDEDNEEEEEDEKATQLPFQVLVSHVCKHWRTVALEASALWTAISFTDDFPPFTRSKTWIERSKTHPIDVSIDCTVISDLPVENKDDEDDGSFEQTVKLLFSHDDLKLILSIITPHIDRLRGFELQVNVYEYMHLATSTFASLKSAPNLEVLQLYYYDQSDDDENDDNEHFKPADFREPFPILFSGNAPNLTHIALWGVHIAWSDNLFLNNLRDLEMAYHAEDVRPSWDEFKQILNSSPDLDTLSLCLSGPSGQPHSWQNESPIELLGLKNLVLAYHPPEYISPLLNLLHIPNVTTLALDFDTDDYTSFARQIAAPRPGSSSNKSLLKGLEHLKISGLPCDNSITDVMYEQLGNLHSINLNCSYLDDVFFEKLGRPISSASSTAPAAFYLPHLDTLTSSGISGDDMREFIETRNKAGIPIKRLFMSENDDVDIKQEIWLRDHLETFELFEPSDEESDMDEDMIDMDAMELT